MKKRTWLTFLLCCMLIVIAACRPTFTETPLKPTEAVTSSVQVAQVTGTAPVNTATVPVAPPGTQWMTKPRTPTPLLQLVTATRAPTITLPAESATPRPTWTAQPTSTATQQVYRLDINNSINNGVSPDGAWGWAVLSEPTGDRVLYTQFVSADGKIEWRVRPSEDDPVRMEFQNRYYQPFFWLPNDPYVYLVGQACCVDGPFLYFTGMALARLNLDTGQLAPWPSNWEIPYTYSFAPSGAYLLSTYPGAGAVQVTRLRDSRTITVPLPERFSQAGMAQWSPDSRHVTLFACDTEIDWNCTRTPVILIDPQKTEFVTIISDVGEALGGECVIEWADGNHVVLFGPAYDLVYDVEQGKLTKREK